MIEKCRDVLGGVPVEDRRVDVDGEALGLRRLDRRAPRCRTRPSATPTCRDVPSSPSRWTEKNKYGDGSNRCSFFSSNSALVQSETNFLRATMPLTISPISRWISGSPPGIATIGAPHSSTASRQSLTDRRWLRIGSGIIDLAAADAGEIAAEQRLQHQHERIALAAHDPLLEEVGADAYFLEKGNCS